MSTLAEHILWRVNRSIIEPARRKTEAVVVAGEVHSDLRLKSRMPLL